MYIIILEVQEVAGVVRELLGLVPEGLQLVPSLVRRLPHLRNCISDTCIYV